MKKIIIISILFIAFLKINSQEKLFTIEDVVQNSYSTLAPEKISQLKAIPNSSKYSYIDEKEKQQYLFIGTADSREITQLLGLEELNSLLGKVNIEELKSFPRITWINEEQFYFWSQSRLIHFNIKMKGCAVVNEVDQNATEVKVAPNNNRTAFTVDNNLFVAAGLNDIRQLSNNEEGIVSGQSVHRNEFGISGGMFWSPNSNLLAYYHKDESMVNEYPLVEMGTTPATLKFTRYPMAGQTSEQVKIAVYNVESKLTVWLETGDPLDQYYTCVTWGPESKYIYIVHLNRDQDHARMIKYDASTGKQVTVLFEEKDEQFVEPDHQLIFLSNDPEHFLWLSERDGWNHLYLYNTDGKLIRQVTKGEWMVLAFEGFDKNAENIFVSATKDSPIENHLYKIDLESSETTLITKKGFNHSISKFEGEDLFIDTYTSLDLPRKIDILDFNGKVLKNLLTSKNPIDDYRLGKTEIFTINAVDGTELYCRMIYPTDFDATKKYPVIFYVYGGPHAQLVTNIFPSGRYHFWFHYMAQHGYLIFTVDNRGSANRGLEFEQATFGRLGTIEVQDQLAGLNHLRTKSFVDTDRVGVFGWSYGGFMTTSLMLRTGGAFKVGVGGGSVIDWKYYEVMYTERYMDTPQKNPEGYKESSLLNYVDNLEGKLLLVHGTMDPTVVWQNTLEFAKKAANLNKPLDYFPYVNHRHGVRGKDTIHLYNKISQYFFDNL